MRRTKILIAALVIQCATALTCYAGCLSGDCKNGVGKLQSTNGRVYEGEFKNGFLWGRGRLVSPDGMQYDGEFVRGKFHGFGILKTLDGRSYKGTF